MGYQFNRERKCPKCGATFDNAEQKTEFDPVVVVLCPSCGEMLWRPGFDEDADLFPYDPNADEGGL